MSSYVATESDGNCNQLSLSTGIDFFLVFNAFLLFSLPLNITISQPNLALSVNTTLSGPLLSRFDIVLVLLDKKNPEWDAVVSSHILAEVICSR